ncbi:glycolate oxidase subunit GlcE [Phenylobacterium conjunctum]|uniref:Glycolate oxidase subunit GlcE n=1 Tax=Phenylobacterium conjunctum TaxID=1298959 RepID=A0ABW3SZW9_9CAUL
MDLTQEIADRVRAATGPLRIAGAGTKAWYGRAVVGEVLDLTGHSGIVDYDPSELVVTARAGTPLAEIEAAIAAHGQMLAFEPPAFGTLGGAVATGLAGPRRPFTGAVRDYVLGVRVLDGRGDVLRFGGTVFKNVAGFDAFRLMSGAHGTLGVILDVSLRVTPRPRVEVSLAFDMAGGPARDWVTGLMVRPLPLSGAFHDGERLHLRLSGGEAAVSQAAAELGGEAEGLELWSVLRDLKHPALAGPVLWRIALPQTADIPALEGRLAWDWGGGQVWLSAEAADPQVWTKAAAAGGHATLIRGGKDQVFQPLEPALFKLHQRIKAALDPAGILNPGRMHEGL